MNVNNFYEVKIYNSHSSTLNANINDVKIFNIQVVDYNNNPLKDKTIEVSCDKGHFVNWSNYDADANDIHTLNNVKNFTGTTDTDGKFDCTYRANEWGLCTISCDTVKLQLFVVGFKTMNVTSQKGYKCTFQVDESYRSCRLVINLPSHTLVNSESTPLDTIGFPKQEYYPPLGLHTSSYRSDIKYHLKTNGELMGRTYDGLSSSSVSAHTEVFEWHY